MPASVSCPSIVTSAWTPDRLTSRNAIAWWDADDIMGASGDRVSSLKIHGTHPSPILMGTAVTMVIESGKKFIRFTSDGIFLGGGQINPLTVNGVSTFDLGGVALGVRYRSPTSSQISLIEKGNATHYPFFMRITPGGGGSTTSGIGYYDNAVGAYVGTSSPVAAINTWHSVMGKLFGTTGTISVDGGTASTTTIVTPLPTSDQELVLAHLYIGNATFDIDMRRGYIIDLTAGDLSADDQNKLSDWLAG